MNNTSSKIKNFQNPDDSAIASWVYDGQKIVKGTNGRLIAIKTHAGNILAVHIDKSYGSDNAFLYGPDGTVLRKIVNPVERAVCFDDVFYTNYELTLISGSASKRVACVIDESGNLIRTYETR